jgi:hypothetical protein
LVEAVSRDNGQSWSVTSALSLDADTRGMRAVRISEEDAEAMALDVRRMKILALRRIMGRWLLRPEPLLDAKTSPMITVSGNQLSLSFGQTRPSNGPDGAHDAPVLVTTSRAYRCEPPSETRSQKRLRAPPRGKSTPR